MALSQLICWSCGDFTTHMGSQENSNMSPGSVHMRYAHTFDFNLPIMLRTQYVVADSFAKVLSMRSASVFRRFSRDKATKGDK